MHGKTYEFGFCNVKTCIICMGLRIQHVKSTGYTSYPYGIATLSCTVRQQEKSCKARAARIARPESHLARALGVY
ncbi:hypothetical protein WUBG_11123 [Wuchereria bancrofti]|nr:hypothetical protein WUBG_11123 [Wuchereria bancrofti]